MYHLKNIKLYKPADKYIVYNDDDPDLIPIVLSLPFPPDITLIDGYGLHPDEQVFKPLEIPQKIDFLEKRAVENLRELNSRSAQQAITKYKILEEFWQLFDEEQNDLKEEIKFIKKIHWCLRHGYWCFIDGKPTYIPPWYFQYLNFWYMPDTESGHPDYREIDRETALFKWYCYTVTETFREIDQKGNAVKRDGRYEMVDIGYRVCLGYTMAKRRRGGYSNQALNDNLWIASRNKRGDVDIVADTGEGAKIIWEQIFLPSWNNMPIFMEPINDATSNPSEIKLIPPRNVFKVKSLGSILGYTGTASERGNDKRKLYALLSDEEGKTILKVCNTRERWEINKLTLAQFEKIHGFAHHISSVEDMNDGGYVFEELNNQSNFYHRLPNGQTVSGCYRIFHHSWHGLDGYIGPFGESIIDKPTERQIRLAPAKSLYAKTGKGAKEALSDYLDTLLLTGRPSDIITYKERLRKMPRYYADCWVGMTGDMGWDIVALDRRMEEIKREGLTRRVNLEWINGSNYLNGVTWKEDKINGKFIVSELFLNKPPSIPVYYGEQFYVDRNINIKSHMPINPIGCAGGDPFKWGNKTEAQLSENKSYMSDGGGIGYWNYDQLADGGKPTDEWQSARVIWTYKNRVSQREYFEDMAKASVFFNMMLNVERNIIDMIKFFLEIGLYGYLLRIPKIDGKLDDTPGYFLQDKSGLFRLIREYNMSTINRERHIEILQDMREIKGPDQLFKYDRLAALGGALMGAKSMGYLNPVIEIDSEVDIDISDTEYGLRMY